MKLYNGLPLYRVVIDPENKELGMDAISLVDNPAVGDLFLKFQKEHKLISFAANEEKHIITGVALSCNLPIYRIFDGVECYVTFDRETIEMLVLDYSKKNLFNSVNLQHDDNKFVDGVYMIESYFVDRNRGIAPVEFPDIEDGSFIVSFKVTNAELWEDIKTTGELNGFSIQGYFDLSEIDEPAPTDEDEMESYINSLFAVQEREMRNYLNDRKQVLVTIDGKTYKGQIYAVGKTNGERTAIIQNNDNLTWYNVKLDDIEKIVQTEDEIAMWNRNVPSYEKIMDNPDITTDKTISAPQKQIEFAMENNLPVMISYYDGENNDGRGYRQCIIGAYGYTKRGNECIRVYQYFGASHSEPSGTGIWRLLLCKRIENMQIIEGMEPVDEAPSGFNPSGDDAMTGELGTVLKIAEFLY